MAARLLSPHRTKTHTGTLCPIWKRNQPYCLAWLTGPAIEPAPAAFLHLSFDLSRFSSFSFLRLASLIPSPGTCPPVCFLSLEVFPSITFYSWNISRVIAFPFSFKKGFSVQGEKKHTRNWNYIQKSELMFWNDHWSNVGLKHGLPQERLY